MARALLTDDQLEAEIRRLSESEKKNCSEKPKKARAKQWK